jgi:hypothetical protein
VLRHQSRLRALGQRANAMPRTKKTHRMGISRH